MPLLLYPFRKRDPSTGKWYRGVVESDCLEEIAKLGGVIDGEPEIRQSAAAMSGYSPYRNAVRAPAPIANADMQPVIDDG